MLSCFGIAGQDSLLLQVHQIAGKQERLQAIVQLVEGDDIEETKIGFLLCSEGIQLAKELNDSRALLALYKNEGLFFNDISNFARVAETYNLALKLAYQLQDIKEQISILRSLGDNARTCSEHKLALRYLFEAYKKNLMLNEPLSTAFTENRIAAVYFELSATFAPGNVFFDSTLTSARFDKKVNRWLNKDYIDSTIHFSEKSMRIGYRLNDDFLITSNLNILGALFEVVGEYEKSYQMLFKGLQYNININSESGQVEILRNLGMVLWKQGKRKEAIKTLLHADSLLGSDEGGEIVKKEIAQRLSGFFSDLQDYKNAFKYSKIAHDLVLHIFDHDLKSKLLNAKAEQEHTLSEEKLNLEKRINFYSILTFSVLSFFMLIIAALLYHRHRTLKKINSELHSLNRTILQQRDELNELNVSKDKFFSIIAHDLKSPIMGLSGYSDIILEDYDKLSDKERAESFVEINKSIKGVADLTQNLLRWAELQLKRKKNDPVYYNFKEATEAIASVFKTNLLAKELVFVDEVENNTLVYCDKDAVYSVLHNLFSNALKFSERGGVIHITCRKEDENVTIGIKDSGKGIPTDQIKKLFRLDVHISTKGTEGEKGTGLGLLICKEMIEQNNGSIWAENNSDKGAAFYFTIPVRPPSNFINKSTERKIIE